MADALLGRKLGMTRIFTPEGRWVHVTVLQAGPCTVVQRKKVDTDGYDAVQVGFEDVKESRSTKPLIGHFAKAGLKPKRFLREFRLNGDSELKVGDEITSEIFKPGDQVDVSGRSKGKGFQGVMKRHNMQGGPGAHGSHFHREPGSIGACADPSRVFKGQRLPGQMGNANITTQNLQVVEVNTEENLIVVLGAVPGARGGLVTVKRSVKRK